MRLALQEARAQFSHGGSKGTGVERAARDFFRHHLNSSYDVGEGEIIDSFGRRSAQADVVVVDEDHPFTFPEGEPGLYLVECVVAAAEIKSVLTTSEITDVLRKARRFKDLEKSSQPGDQSFVPRGETEDRYFLHAPFFCLTFETNVRTETLLTRLAADDRQHGTKPTGLDALFVLGKGVAANLGDGTDSFGVRVGGVPYTGWVWWNSDAVLGELLVWLAGVSRRTIRFYSPILAYLAGFLGTKTLDVPDPP